jgi:hypothetical protein
VFNDVMEEINDVLVDDNPEVNEVSAFIARWLLLDNAEFNDITEEFNVEFVLFKLFDNDVSAFIALWVSDANDEDNKPVLCCVLFK